MHDPGDVLGTKRRQRGSHTSRIGKNRFDLYGLQRHAFPAWRIALAVAVIFVLVGLAWVFLTDIVLYRVTRDRVIIARFETAKGWIFVCSAGLLLYVLVLHSAAHLARAWRLNAAIIEDMSDGVLVVGRDQTIALANAAALRMLGCRADELIGMDVPKFLRRFRVSYPDGTVIPPESYISRYIYDKGGELHHTAVLRRCGGGRVVVRATIAPVRTRMHGPALWVANVLHDITEADKFERLRDQFFAAAAHSLKTPVAIIKADVRALTTTSPEQRRVTASLDRQCDRIDRLVQNMLVLARTRSRTLELHQVEMDLEPVVEQIARDPVWSHRHDVDAQVSGSPRVYADPERLALVIRDLLHEADRLSPPESPLTLQAGLEGDQVAIGIHYVPLPWRDYASDLYDEYDDIGIGRSVASVIVEAHGGALSEEIKDSKVVIWIHLPS